MFIRLPIVKPKCSNLSPVWHINCCWAYSICQVLRFSSRLQREIAITEIIVLQPVQFEVTDGIVQLRAIHWPFFWECAVGLPTVNQLPMVCAKSASAVHALGFCQMNWPLACGIICKCSGQWLQFLEIVVTKSQKISWIYASPVWGIVKGSVAEFLFISSKFLLIALIVISIKYLQASRPILWLSFPEWSPGLVYSLANTDTRVESGKTRGNLR
jgi:hypothetical protein